MFIQLALSPSLAVAARRENIQVQWIPFLTAMLRGGIGAIVSYWLVTT